MSDAAFMALALAQACVARDAGEVPVGAVLVREGQVIAVGSNAPIGHHDPTAHAEIVALRAAALALGNYRLDDCSLYVTLEPCAMCVGAMLHARLQRVVFGAADPKTGAAGSILDLFSNPQLNHQTQVQGGVLADECSALLQEFFKVKREANRISSSSVREDAVRTADARFDLLPGFPWQAHYLSDLPSLQGLRMHYVDEGTHHAPLTYLCLHGNPAWSYFYRKMIPVFLAAGNRVVAPDLIGFGKSDKPKKDAFHQFTWHRQVLLELVERLDLKNVVLVLPDWGAWLGLSLPMANECRYCGLLVIHDSLDAADAAYEAPFPDRGHRAALRAFPSMEPKPESSDGSAISQQARRFWRERWTGQTLLAIGKQDTAADLTVLRDLQQLIRGCPEPIVMNQAELLVQEHSEPIAQRAVQYFVSPQPV